MASKLKPEDFGRTIAMHREALAHVKNSLEKHPGDAPWSCTECYFNRPCIERLILRAALENIEKFLKIWED